MPFEQITKLLGEYGFPVVVAIALGFFIYKLMKEFKEVMTNHREERKEWRQEITTITKETNVTIDKNSDAINKQNELIRDVRTMLSTLNKVKL